jgi:cell division protein FtsW
MARAATLARPVGLSATATLESSRPSRFGVGWEAPSLLLIAVLLLSFGIVTVYSASAVMAQAEELPDYHYVVSQLVGGALGLLLLVAAAHVDYRILRLLAWPLVIGTILVLAITILPGTQAIAPEINNVRRWLVFGPVQIQPSEFAKLTIIAWTAALAVKKQDKLRSLSRGLLPFLMVWFLVFVLIAMQPSFSAAAMVLLLAGLVVFAAGGRIGHFLMLGIIGLPVLWQQVDNVGYRLKRIVAFIDPGHDVEGLSYQINQSLIAIGSGGVLGRGFGRGQQKFGFLPEPHNDFIFAMIGEEWGFLGLLAIIILFTSFALIGYRIARNAPDLFGSLLALGLTNLIVVQGLLHMGVNLALIPTTGITLPFLSYGRSSLLVCLVAVGILMNIARRSEKVE